MKFCFAILVVSGIACSSAAIRMKLQVNSSLPEGQKFSWWYQNSWRVAKKHRELYPGSRRWLISRASCFVVLGLMLGLVAITLFIKS
jgi:hypothetical protein